jgi:predicted DNA-binding transcriptional regulator AlpA
MTQRTFDELRKNREFPEYECLGVKFFSKEDIKMWKEKRRPHLKIISKPEYFATKGKK